VPYDPERLARAYRSLEAAMTSKHSLTVSLASALIALAACGSDDTPTQTVETEPPTIAITELRPRGADVWRSGDAERLGVSVELTNFILRPRGACGGVSECGYLHATLTGPDGATLTVETAIDSFVFDFAGFEALPVDAVAIRVALHSDSGMPILTPEGDEIATELDVLLAADDCELGAAGAGGEAGNGAAGASGVSGASGAEGGAGGASGGTPGLGGEGGASGGDAGHAGDDTAGAGGVASEGASGSGGDAVVVSGAGGA
jgi:hypothetical protein